MTTVLTDALNAQNQQLDAIRAEVERMIVDGIISGSAPLVALTARRRPLRETGHFRVS